MFWLIIVLGLIIVVAISYLRREAKRYRKIRNLAKKFAKQKQFHKRTAVKFTDQKHTYKRAFTAMINFKRQRVTNKKEIDELEVIERQVFDEIEAIEKQFTADLGLSK